MDIFLLTDVVGAMVLIRAAGAFRDAAAGAGAFRSLTVKRSTVWISSNGCRAINMGESTVAAATRALAKTALELIDMTGGRVLGHPFHDPKRRNVAEVSADRLSPMAEEVELGFALAVKPSRPLALAGEPLDGKGARFLGRNHFHR